MQEDTMGNSKIELMKQLMENDRKLTVLQTQISVLERLYRSEPGGVSKQALEDIFGFEPTKVKTTKTITLSPESAAKRAAGAAKARAIKAAKKDEATKSPADMLKEIAEKKSKKDATPKDYTEIRGMQQAGLSIDDIVEETGFSKKSILKLVNDSPKDAFD